jgi:HAD domain in Swiss Army Knife RNA repair proteins
MFPEKIPKGRGDTILYLDFDGVLHHHNCLWSPRIGPYISAAGAANQYVVFQHVPLLVKLLEPFPQVRIVLSTSWVRSYGCHGAAKRLPLSLRERVIGATFHSRMNVYDFVAMPRGVQILEDVQRRKPKAWFALDDDFEGWPESCLENYIRTHEEDGIGAPDVKAAIERKLAQLAEVAGFVGGESP